MNNKLYIVSTPIGNLEDITLRALKILKNVDIIACEDTRITRILLDHYNIKNKCLISFHSYNQDEKIKYIIHQLQNNKTVALVSDSGTPCISDPGYLLVKKTLQEKIPIEVIPGATGLICALVGSGLPTNGFIFLGFLPKKKGKIKKILLNCVSLNKTIIFYESPYRIKKTLEICKDIFSTYRSHCVVARELTKKFEEYIRGTLEEVISELNNRKSIKGEIITLLFLECQT